MISTTVVAQFGSGTLSIGAGSFKNQECWYISIRPTLTPKTVGEKLEKTDVEYDGQEIYLTFPSEEQMLRVYAALGKKTYEVIKEKWDTRKADAVIETKWETKDV